MGMFLVDKSPTPQEKGDGIVMLSILYHKYIAFFVSGKVESVFFTLERTENGVWSKNVFERISS